MADLLGVGVSGLLAFQRALSTTSHNIANVNTEGYSRQRTEFATYPPQYLGAGYLGKGVYVDAVRRMYDGFLTDQVRSSTSAFSQLDRYHALAGQIDNILADPSTGLSGALQNFFGATQTAANDPASIPARQVMLSEAGNLDARFAYLHGRLSDLDRDINTRLQSAVSEINGLATELARINRQITLLPGQGSSPPPNDLLDRREQLIKQLSEHVSVSTVLQDNGAMNVFIGNGQALVVGTDTQALSAVRSEFEATRFEVGYDTGSATINISSQVSGGSLGALLSFRTQMLDPARNALGRLAQGITETFNAQHALGLDLNGTAGGDFFRDIAATSPSVSASNANTGTGVVAATISNVSALTTSDYVLARSGATYTLTRSSDGTVTTLGTFPGGSETVDGITISLSSGAISSGDRFLIRPTQSGANDFAVAISDPRRIALAGPLLGSGTVGNTGTGNLSAVSVSAATALPLSGGNGTITLTYDTANLRFNVTDGSGLVGTVNYNPATNDGAALTLPSPLNFISVTFTGTPSNGDTFAVSDNTGSFTDNRNGLTLSALQYRQTLVGSTASYGETYGQLIADVGAKTRAAEIGRGAQQVLREQALAAQSQVSGVNLDEEAADLVRYQQAYQASAQVIATANQLFDTLLVLMRR
jgi:flagellar hook-associated protein 1 FlgK